IRDYKVTGVQTCALPILSAQDLDLADDDGVEDAREPRARAPWWAMSLAFHAALLICLPLVVAAGSLAQSERTLTVSLGWPRDARSEERRVGKARRDVAGR